MNEEIRISKRVWRVTVYRRKEGDVLSSVETDPVDAVSLVAGTHFPVELPSWPCGEKVPVIDMRGGEACLVLGTVFSGINVRNAREEITDHLTQMISRGLRGPLLHPLQDHEHYELFLEKYRIEVRYEWRKSDDDHKAARTAIAFLEEGCEESGDHGCYNGHGQRQGFLN